MADSRIENVDREQLEADIIAIAATQEVQDALEEWAGLMAGEYNYPEAPPSTIQDAAQNPEERKREFERGVKAILSASSDMRLQTFHWMLCEEQKAGNSGDIVECFFFEAEHQTTEAEEEEAEVIARIFGVGRSDA